MDKGFTVLFAETQNPLKDILIPSTRRPGYTAGSNPIVPTYFYRQVGMNGLDSNAQNTFYNDILKLDLELSKHPSGYARLESPIAMPTNDEIQSMIGQVARGNAKQNVNLKEKVLSRIVHSGALRMFSSDTFNINVTSAFDQAIEMYMVNEQHINESKAENFALKMLVWLNRYKGLLFKEQKVSDTPKVLFYGDIKAHEVYFLNLLALMGVDVLFVHTDKSKDLLFDSMKQSTCFSKRVELPDSKEMEAFPKTERVVQKNTVAYNASQELNTMLYGSDVGLFKAWQYQGGDTKAVMLKTTYDEFKILWQEQAKIRPEFEVRNEQVYVPNMFAKINGTHEDLNRYWNDFHSLSNATSVAVYKEIPFTRINYTKQEMYSTAFLFSKDGFVEREALFQSPVYKLQYLKRSIQDFIVAKINELIASKMFLKEMDEELRIKILMTVITMDTQLLRLIESFDYTKDVPKILLYSGGRENLSEEDGILLAFFHLVGADIAIFTPTSYLNVEQWIGGDYIATHQLTSQQFDLAFKEKSISSEATGFWSRLKRWFDNLLGQPVR